jgi:hypothetical protein
MRTLVLLLISLRAFGACGNGYLLCRPITINSITGTIADYPLLISGSYPFLFDSGNGGNVQHPSVAQSPGGPALNVPADVIFTTDSTCGTLVQWDWKAYSPGTLASVFIRVPLAATGTVLWACYDNALGDGAAWRGDVHGTWASTYKLVDHLGDINSSCVLTCASKDSTSNANDATYSGGAGITSVSGLVGSGLGLTGAAWLTYATPVNSTDVTMSVWFNSPTASSQTGFLFASNDYPNWHPTIQIVGGHVTLYGGSTAITCPTTLTDNIWHQVVGKIVSGVGTVYLDGVNCQSAPAPATSGTISIWLGNSQSFNSSFAGSIDLYRVRDSDISDAQVAAEYSNYLTPSSFYTVGAELVASSGVKRRIIQ